MKQATNDAAPKRALAAKQERSRQLRDRVIDRGRVLVEQGGFAGTSMAEIARAAGCSVGALYYRFPDKDALFDCVIEQATSSALETIRAKAAAGRYRLSTTAKAVHAVIEDFADFIQDNQGMIRVVYQRALEESRYWAVVRTTGFAMGSIWTAAILDSSDRPGDPQFRRQVRIALAHVTGVLTYAALVSEAAGSHLSREEQIHWLALVATQIIEAPPFQNTPPAQPEKPKAKRRPDRPD